MKTVFWIVLGVIFILGGLFLYLPPFAGIPCLGWYEQLKELAMALSGGVAILIGLIFLAISK